MESVTMLVLSLHTLHFTKPLLIIKLFLVLPHVFMIIFRSRLLETQVVEAYMEQICKMPTSIIVFQSFVDERTKLYEEPVTKCRKNCYSPTGISIQFCLLHVGIRLH